MNRKVSKTQTPGPRRSTKRNHFMKKIKQGEVIKYLRREVASCTTHGLPYIARSDIHWIERVFWLVSFVTANVLVVVLLSPLYARLILSPTVMSLEKDYFNWNVSYPAITLCPKRKVDIEAFAYIVAQYKLKTGLDLTSYLWIISNLAIDNLNSKDLQDVKNIKLIRPEDYASIAARAFSGFTNVSLTTNAGLAIAIEPAMTEMGMCNVINSNVAAFDDPLKWRENIETVYHKNSIELSFFDAEFFTQITNYESSYTVYVHSPDEVLHSTTAAYSYDKAGFLSIGVSVWSTRIADQLRPTPLSVRKCRLLMEPTSKRYPVYTFNHCMLECRIKTILRLCGCVPHFYKPLKGERICNLSELNCLVHYKREISTLSSNPVTLGQSNTDAKPSKQCACLSGCDTDVYHKDYEITTSHSLNRLRVGLASFPNVRVVREVIFSLDDILLKIGGVINLCIGCSIISIMESILIYLKMIYHIIRRYAWETN